MKTTVMQMLKKKKKKSFVCFKRKKEQNKKLQAKLPIQQFHENENTWNQNLTIIVVE